MESCGPFEIVVDARGQVLHVGTRITALVGVPVDELIDRPLGGWLRGAALNAPPNHPSALELRPDGRPAIAGIGVRAGDGSRQTITFVPEPNRTSPRARAGEQRLPEVGREIQDALTGVIGFANLVPVAPTPHRRKYYVEQVIAQADRVRRLVHVYDMPPGTHHAPFVRPADVSASLSRALSGLRASLERGGVGFDIELGNDTVWAACDIRQVCDLVTALIQRATTQQRREYQANEVLLKVAGDGHGARATARVELVFTGAERPKALMYEPFGTDEEAAATSMNEIELRAGIAALESQDGKMTLTRDHEHEEVVITLRLPGTRAPRRPDTLRTPVPLDVLVIDDDPMIGELYQEMLQVAGHTVVARRTVSGAREALRDQRFDVVVAEFQFKDGLLSELWAMASQTHPELASRLVVATRDPAEPRLVEWAAQGDTPILAKPFMAPTLLEQLALMV